MASKVLPLVIITALLAHLCIRLVVADDFIWDTQVHSPNWMGVTEQADEASEVSIAGPGSSAPSFPISFDKDSWEANKIYVLRSEFY